MRKVEDLILQGEKNRKAHRLNSLMQLVHEILGSIPAVGAASSGGLMPVRARTFHAGRLPHACRVPVPSALLELVSLM